MRNPTIIIILSSVALALLVLAENAPHNGPVAAVPVLAGPVAASPDHNAKAQASLQVSTDAQVENRLAEVPPKDEAAKDTKANSKTKDAKVTKDTKDSEYKESDARPVGKGIVMTTTSFTKSKHGGFLNNLLGIDLDLNLGGDDGDGKKKKKKDGGVGGAEPSKKVSGFETVMVIPDDVPLYGDDGYVPRPLPVQPDEQPPCPPLAFLDQMVWDMQGTSGTIIEASATPPVPETDADDHAATDATVHTDGLRICILGLCIGEDDDDDDKDREKDDDGDDPKPHKKHIHHKQRKFLREIAKQTPLSIDGRTGCPIPTMPMARDKH